MEPNSSSFDPDMDLIERALKLHNQIVREGRFNNSEEARGKQDTAFADELVQESEVGPDNVASSQFESNQRGEDAD